MPFVRPESPDDARGMQRRIASAMVQTSAPHEVRRTLIGVAMSWAVIWGVVVGSVAFVPSSYTSRSTLILPGAGSTISLSLETIGQSSSAPQPQSGPHLSPKVIYKEIAQSDRVRSNAALSMGLSVTAFGRPRIKLIDETALILLEMQGGTPEIAQSKATALHVALTAQLDILRRDELDKRAAAVRDNLKGYQEQVDLSRARILEAQRASGLASVNQFNELSSSVVLARRRHVDLQAEMQRTAHEQALLIAKLGIEPQSARLALEMSGNAAFARLATELADANAVWRAEQHRLGPANPVLVNMQKRRTGVLQQLVALTGPAARVSPPEVERLAILIHGSQQADLLRTIVINEALLEGRRHELTALEASIERLQREVRDMGEVAARLEELRKDQLVAEAVLTSALARLDTTKSDLYGSYPLLQVLAAPDLPEKPSHPVVLLAIAGGFAGSFFAAVFWTLLWWKRNLVHARPKKA